MEIWDAINDTLSVVVWPGVALVAVVVLREPISGLIGRVRSAEAFGASITLEKVNDEFSTRARNAVKEVDQATGDHMEQQEAVTPTNNGGDRLPVASQGSLGKAADGDGVETWRDEPRFTKSQVEKFIQAAGIAGWEIGTIRMFQGPAEPVVNWTDDDVPEINHWSSAHLTDVRYGSERWYRSKPGGS